MRLILLLAVLAPAASFILQHPVKQQPFLFNAMAIDHYADKSEQQLTLVFVRRHENGHRQVLLGCKRRVRLVFYMYISAFGWVRQ
jgi:hypothetical protein